MRLRVRATYRYTPGKKKIASRRDAETQRKPTSLSRISASLRETYRFFLRIDPMFSSTRSRVRTMASDSAAASTQTARVIQNCTRL